MRLDRRTTLSLALIAVLPAPLWAEDPACTPLVVGLSLCVAADWTVEGITDGGATLIHASGITAGISIETSLPDEAMMWENWMQSHAPISARADVQEVGLASIDGRFATTAAYLPRHASPPMLVVLTGHVDAGLSLRVSTQETAESYTNLHRAAHAGLLAAQKLDPPE